MIADLYENKKPFAVCIDIIEIGDSQVLDVFAAVPNEKYTEWSVRFKGFHPIGIRDLTKSDKDWVRSHKEMLRLVHKDTEGAIYEPYYCNFKQILKSNQLSL